MINRYLRPGWTRALVVVLTLLTLLAPGFTSLRGQAAEAVSLVVHSVGLIDDDDTVLYSVNVASGPNALDKLTVSAALPDTATLIEAVSAPKGISAKTDARAASWTIEHLDTDSILGPFTFRVRFEDGVDIPANVAATASWSQPTAGTAQVVASSEKLKRLADSGTLTVNAKGTLNNKGENAAVKVGDTGIWVLIPAGAVSKSVKLTFSRLLIDEKNIPADAKDTWWCALIGITSDSDVDFATPISLILPTRRTLTPGLSAKVFVDYGDSQWTALDGQNAKLTHFVSGSGNLVVINAVSLLHITERKQVGVAIGTSGSGRTVGLVSRMQLPAPISDQGKQSSATSFVDSNIEDFR